VPIDEIDRRYFDRPYYIVPEGKAGEEAFAVIRDAMKDKGRVALAQIVLTNREHVMAIEPMGKGLLGTILRYDYEVRDEKALFRGVPSPRIPKEMVKLASHILDTKAGHFDPSDFKDEFELELRKLVKRKAAGKTIEVPEHVERPSNVVDLMQALRQSVSGRRNQTAALRTSSSSKKTSKPRTRRSTTKKRKPRRAA
jgi:DNA end-binding protein Ku